MTDQTAAAPGGSEGVDAPIAVVTPADDATQFSDARSAGRMLAELRWKRNNPDSAPDAAAPAEAAQQEPQPDSGTEPEAAPPVEDPGQTPTDQQAEPAEELPPIDPPRSWTKDEKERFQSLPRDVQEYVAQREQEREREIRRSQNEAAEQRKALEAKLAEVDQARQQYDTALPTLLQTLQQQLAGDFSDIKTMADVAKLARDDPFRYSQWDVAQKQVAAVQQELRDSQQRQQQEAQSRWSEFARKQDEMFLERAPEFKDSAKAAKMQEAAVSALKDIGFSEKELADLWSGQAAFSLRDHRAQLLILDGIRYRETKANAAKVAVKPVPPVQRPGAAKPAMKAADAELQALQSKFDATGDWKIGAQLLNAKRKAGIA